MPTPSPSPATSPASAVSQPVLSTHRYCCGEWSNITTADFEPDLRQEIDSVEQRVKEARSNILELQINKRMLLAAEAKKKGITPHQLYEVEVSKKIPVPTEAEIKKVMTDNQEQLQEWIRRLQGPRSSPFFMIKSKANLPTIWPTDSERQFRLLWASILTRRIWKQCPAGLAQWVVNQYWPQRLRNA